VRKRCVLYKTDAQSTPSDFGSWEFDKISILNEEKDRIIMKEFVAYIIKNLVDHPDKVKITEIGGTQTLIIELSVEKADIGKIIGKKGKTINAIRTLLMSVASRNGIRVNLEILEEGSKPEAQA
jgi:predicted RNA-binding protein YlqC (UPF0109 family)